MQDRTTENVETTSELYNPRATSYNAALNCHAYRAETLWDTMGSMTHDVRMMELRRRFDSRFDRPRCLARLNEAKEELADCVADFRDVVGMPVEAPLNL